MDKIKLKYLYQIIYSETNKHIEIGLRIEKLTQELIENYIINANGVKYKIVECEVYLNGINETFKINHKDKYTHSKKEQLRFGNWYDHPAGIDFTIGDEELIFGGILIRSIKNTNSENFTNGPLNTKKELFSNFENKSIAITTLKLDYFSRSNNKNLEIFKVMRYGLSLTPSVKDFKDFEKYRTQKYRFITDFNPSNKIKAKELILDQLLFDKQINWDRIIQKSIITYIPKKLKEKYDQR